VDLDDPLVRLGQGLDLEDATAEGERLLREPLARELAGDEVRLSEADREQGRPRTTAYDPASRRPQNRGCRFESRRPCPMAKPKRGSPRLSETGACQAPVRIGSVPQYPIRSSPSKGRLRRGLP
jgi:hypothetical protein